MRLRTCACVDSKFPSSTKIPKTGLTDFNNALAAHWCLYTSVERLLLDTTILCRPMSGLLIG